MEDLGVKLTVIVWPQSCKDSIFFTSLMGLSVPTHRQNSMRYLRLKRTEMEQKQTHTNTHCTHLIRTVLKASSLQIQM